MIRFGRRALLLGGAAAGLAPMALPRLSASAFAAEGADALVLVLSDLHSAYGDFAPALATLDRVLARHKGMPALIVVNGDLFERGNVVALRSGGEADFAFLKAVAERAPTIFNLGNHETALIDDMVEVVKRIEAVGASVVTSMKDKRTGQPMAPPSAERTFASRSFTVAGIATNDLTTYREAARVALDIPAPGPYASEHLKSLLGGADIPVLATHAGVVWDRGIVSGVADGTLVIGGHDHLNFMHRHGATLYLHAGAYLRGIAAVVISSHGGARRLDATLIGLERWEPNQEMAELARSQISLHLTGVEKQVVANLARRLSLGEAARILVRAMARAVGGQVGLINHTTLGAGFAAGPVTAYDISNFIRFDGSILRGEIDGVGLAAIFNGANQDEETLLDRRVGDFLYANIEPLSPDRRYVVATNGWVRQNAQRYLGRADIPFGEFADRRIRASFEAVLRG